MNAIQTLNPFRKRAIAPLTRLQLPASMGRSISVGGNDYKADADGVIELPPELASQVEAHLPKAQASTGTNVTAEAVAITSLDAQIRALLDQKATLEAARASAVAMKNAPSTTDAEMAEIAQQKSHAVADYMLGRVKREHVHSIDVLRSKVAASADKERQDRELGEEAIHALNARIEPIDKELLGLRAARSLALRRAVRAHAEHAAREYRAMLAAVARSFGVVQAFALELDALERAGTRFEDLAGGRQGFDIFKGTEIGEFPGVPALAAFAGSATHVSVTFNAADVRAHVRQQLTRDGLVA